MSTQKLIYIEKKYEFDNEGKGIANAIRELMGIELQRVRVLNRYSIDGIGDEAVEFISNTLLGEKNIQHVFYDIPEHDGFEKIIVAYLKGQFDQRADSASQCVKLMYPKWKGEISCAKVYLIKGDLRVKELEKIKEYLINKVDSYEVDENTEEEKVEIIERTKEKSVDRFIDMSVEEMRDVLVNMNLSLKEADLIYIQKYFQKIGRNPSETELKVLDTYWSDHCRHSTFNTILKQIDIEGGEYSEIIKTTLEEYKAVRDNLYEDYREMTMMDLAVIGMKELKRRGKLEDLDVSKEINACSINIDVDNNGHVEKWLLMFKNETHNHPTEIEPFGGAATCIGGAIRDPLSGRSYVYAAMRVTGSADPRESVDETLKGKLPQIKITTEAARGYSSYGNQIGVATGLVDEIYHEGYKAKRMEIGAVIGAVKKENVRREEPSEGDKVLLIGGRTGRDGIGGASGSSVEHDEKSISTCGAQVQKGNAPEERKIQRLFRDADVLRMIKRCNDFGAGGVAVAVGEIAEGLDICLDNVRKKYDGLSGMELAISESQERMAVVVESVNVEKFIEKCSKENIEAYEIARVTGDRKLVMRYKGEKIVDIHRDFLDTNGVLESTDVFIQSPKKNFQKTVENKQLKDVILDEMRKLNRCSKRGLIEQFDSTIGASTVLMPYGGKNLKTPIQTMVHKLPVEGGNTRTVSSMSYGFDVDISSWSPYHGGVFAVLESISKQVATGIDYRKVRLSFQEYFEKLKNDKSRWGKPVAALLGAFKGQMEFEIPAIGGKDSMSGSFGDLDVPPTLVSFSVGSGKVDHILSPEFKKPGSKIMMLKVPIDNLMIPDYKRTKYLFGLFREAVEMNHILGAFSISGESMESSLCKMSFGNGIGVYLYEDKWNDLKNEYLNGSIIFEVEGGCSHEGILQNCIEIGRTTEVYEFKVGNKSVSMSRVHDEWENTLDKVFPINRYSKQEAKVETKEFPMKFLLRNNESAKPKIVIPVFPGTNCEFDCENAFKRAGGAVQQKVFRNLTGIHTKEALIELEKEIKRSNILMIPGGFSAGDEPDGSGKFIASVLRNERIRESIMELLYVRDGLILGICNGFQALVKVGLLPYGDIRDIGEKSPTLAHNMNGKHISKIVKTRVVSNKSPWMNGVKSGEIHRIPISHGEGRFFADPEVIEWMERNGQIATVYCGDDICTNPNGSIRNIEGITSPDGRILGKMGHSERIGNGLYKNVEGFMDQKIFESGVNYFK